MTGTLSCKDKKLENGWIQCVYCVGFPVADGGNSCLIDTPLSAGRFAGPLTEAIKGSELVVFDDCSHAPIYENVAEFNARTMDFLTRNS